MTPSPSTARCHTDAVQITVLAGGVGGSRFVRGVRHCYPEATITVIVNTADDITLHGLHISPDLDTMMYALGGGIDAERGWGRAGETWRTSAELAAYGVEPSWFGLGDLDLATHLVRTQMLAAGYPLSAVTQALCTRWLSDSDHTVGQLRLLPMTDDRVETHVVIDDPKSPSGLRAVHFQEYWVKLRAEPILAVPGVRQAIGDTAAPVVGFSGIIGGAPVLGMAHRLLPAIGVGVDAASVGLHYGPRSAGGVLDAWIVDNADADAVEGLRAAGLHAGSTDLIMKEPAATADFIRHGVKLATE